MFGNLTWKAILFDQPTAMGGGAANPRRYYPNHVKSWWPYLWRA
jgi:hypothetical protein